MSRSIFVLIFLAFTLQYSQAQLSNHGVPASVTSPTADGQTHGVPSSVTSPTRRPAGVNPTPRIGFRIQGPQRRLGNPRIHRKVFVPVPVFYPLYPEGGDPYPSAADPSVPADPQPAQTADAPSAATDRGPSSDRNDEALRDAYLQGAHDALSRAADSRYGEHYMDSRERSRPQPAAADRQPEERRRTEEAAAPPAEDKSPSTVFVFKDGHQMETKNYAIMGGTLFDFSGKTLRKIQVDELDANATVKANDDRGLTVKLQ